MPFQTGSIAIRLLDLALFGTTVAVITYVVGLTVPLFRR